MDELTNTPASDVQAAINAGAALGFAKLPDEGGGIPYAVVPEGYRIEELEALLPTPARQRGASHLRDAASFAAYFKRHESDNSTIWGTIDPPRFVAVFDDHGADGIAGWREHTATYACPLSPEWNTWKSRDGKQMAQTDFAQFVEDNLPDIIAPEAAAILEISRTLTAKKKVDYTSAVRLSNGEVQFAYQEEIQGTTTKGQIQIPEEFVIAIPVFENGPRYRITARLRYRIDDGSKRLVMWFDLLRPHKVLEDAVNEVWQEIADTTGREIFHGSHS